MNLDQFIKELAKINIDISDEQLKQLNEYYLLLVEWNNKINLTRIIEKEDVYLKHFYDSATLNKAINLNEINNLCDFGTGAGFPGIVIKILFPKINVTLVDSLNKRVIFLNEVIKKLNLKNIIAIHSRVEEYSKINREIFDVVVARAVAKLNVLIEYATPLVKCGKYFIAMKANIDTEYDEAKNAIKELDLNLENNINFNLPNEESIRNILVFKKIKKTNLKYPRSINEIKKRPL